ncbi:hypothetical protein GOODEAATRI_004678 [Goodea atripinnis]|uniref:Uncharacterized protein n=1 Tax=Goodea atripinnis TaxID=208336 RepID=A0ABV0MFF1_9TELE
MCPLTSGREGAITFFHLGYVWFKPLEVKANPNNETVSVAVGFTELTIALIAEHLFEKNILSHTNRKTYIDDMAHCQQDSLPVHSYLGTHTHRSQATNETHVPQPAWF